MWLGRICCLAAILWAILLYIKRSFNIVMFDKGPRLAMKLDAAIFH